MKHRHHLPLPVTTTRIVLLALPMVATLTSLIRVVCSRMGPPFTLTIQSRAKSLKNLEQSTLETSDFLEKVILRQRRELSVSGGGLARFRRSMRRVRGRISISVSEDAMRCPDFFPGNVRTSSVPLLLPDEPCVCPSRYTFSSVFSENSAFLPMDEARRLLLRLVFGSRGSSEQGHDQKVRSLFRLLAVAVQTLPCSPYANLA